MTRRLVVALLLVSAIVACGSSSADRGTATVTLDAMSGVPNPTWTLDADQASELLSQWDELATATVVTYPAVLGYRGIIVEFEDGSRLWVTGGIAVDENDGGVEAHGDPERSLELWLLGTGTGTVDVRLLQSIRAEIEA